MKLSIITVNFNNIKGLKKTLESICCQTCKDFEWIVIDGGSTDGSNELLEECSEKIDYWVSEKDHGIYEAMNKGIRVAKGDYLMFLNSGDYLASPEVLQNFYNRKNTEDIIYGNAIIVDSKGNEIKRWHAPEQVRLSYFWSHSLNHQATFFNKRCFDTYLYNESNKIASDVELYMHHLYYGYSFKKYDEYIVCFDNTGVSTQIKEGEFNKVVDHVLPEGIKEDYQELIQFRDIDLAIMIKKIINSNRFVRNITRAFLLPIYKIIK